MEQGILYSPSMPMMPRERQTYTVALAYRVEAASSRVIFALSMPEYIEAWLQAPNVDGLRLTFHYLTQEAFGIELYCAERLQTSIHSSCRIVSANQVQYKWKTISSIAVSETAVDLQIRNSSGGCILGLQHSGFRDTQESAWYCRMWQESLAGLGRLMRKD
jgi:hypothetical protein